MRTVHRVIWLTAIIVLASASDTQAREPPDTSGDGLPTPTGYAPTLDDIVGPPPAPEEPPSSIFERLWGYGRLYANDRNPVLQELSLSGRFQLDYAWIPESDFDTWDVRRLRLGAKAQLFEHFTVHAEADLADDDDPQFDRLTDGYIAWSRSPAFEATIGKQSAPFTMDGSTSSKRLIAIDRSNVSRNLWFTEEYFPGVSVAGDAAPWVYHLGLYSAGATRWLSGSWFVLATVGYDFADAFEAEKALLSFDYVHNDTHGGDTFTADFSDIFSLHLDLDEKTWGARADVSGGLGDLEQSDLLGMMVLSFYNFTERLQAIARYTYLRSAQSNGVRFARYENRVVDGRGNLYQEVYFGLNYYVYGDELKLQTGVDFADMKDDASDGGAYHGWAWTTGLRVSW